LGRFVDHQGRPVVSLDYKAGFLLKRGKEALRSVVRLSPRSRALRGRIKAEERAFARCVKTETKVASGMVREGAARTASFKPDDRADAVYRRLLPGPVDTSAVLADMGPRWRARYSKWLEKETSANLLQPLTLYWMDGRRSLEEISRLIAAETGHWNPGFVTFYLDLLEEAGLVEAVGT
jgi:hypothetical protein